MGSVLNFLAEEKQNMEATPRNYRLNPVTSKRKMSYVSRLLEICLFSAEVGFMLSSALN